PDAVTKISRNGRHDQGVVADVEAPMIGALEPSSVDGPLLVLDGLTNPSNVGMIIRSAAAAGVGVVLPRTGVPDIGPLVIKASAGVAFRARLHRVEWADRAVEALTAAGYDVIGLASGGSSSIFDEGAMSAKIAFVLGSESEGVSSAVAKHVARWVSIPLANGVDSLNVAVAAGVVCFELVRRAGNAP
ncbi:MAG: TrmH family RNA methyltransferase, partial [Acidimicrobiales bacterium]